MKLSAFLFGRMVILTFTALVSGLSAQETTQILKLAAGWNAVPLRVAPSLRVAELMAGQPVDLVTTWYPERSKVASLQDPAAEPWKDTEWRTWQAPGLPGALLNNLHALESGRAYVIKARAACEVTIPGAVAYDRLRWQPQSFNLTGLPADPAAPATLASFFANSPAHQPLKVFRLADGKWQNVPGATRINPAAAYWVWCGEGSEYQGPLDLRTGGNPALTGQAGTISIGLLSTSGTALPVESAAIGGLALAWSAATSGAGAVPQAFSRGTAAGLTADAAVPRIYRITSVNGTGGGGPVSGASSVLEFRAAGVRLTLPVRYQPDVSVP